jgi:hypothetical protein
LDAESISEASRRGPQLYRAMHRAVTAQDYEAFARQFGVSKVYARPAGWNQIEMFVAPAGGGVPSDTLKYDLRLHFEDKRMLTSSVEIEGPRYVDVFIEGDLEVEPYYSKEQVRENVESAVRQWLAFDQVDFGMPLYISKVYEAIEAVPGVRGINITKFFKPPDPPTDLPMDLPPTGKLVFADHEIPTLAFIEGIRLKVSGGRSGG